jgi:hypothetical protein
MYELHLERRVYDLLLLHDPHTASTTICLMPRSVLAIRLLAAGPCRVSDRGLRRVS